MPALGRIAPGPYLLTPFIPVAIALELGHASDAAVFITAALGIIPTAALMSEATQELATRAGPGIGGLLNVTFGNAPELIIALFALGDGLQEVVKAALVGSIAGNVLLVLGAAMLLGGLGRQKQTFSVTTASAETSMLLLAAAALFMPAVVAIVGNAAEHWVAVAVAMKDKMDLAVNIAIGSSTQVALFVAPVLVIVSFFLGPFPMALVFNGFELGAVLLTVLIANYVTNEGESNWFEGFQLLAVYAILGIAFFYA